MKPSLGCFTSGHFHKFFTQVAHQQQQGAEQFPFFRNRVSHFGRHHGIHFSHNQAARLQLPQLVGQHLLVMPGICRCISPKRSCPLWMAQIMMGFHLPPISFMTRATGFLSGFVSFLSKTTIVTFWILLAYIAANI